MSSILQGEPMQDSRFDLSPPPAMSTDLVNYELVRFDNIGDCTSQTQYRVFSTDQSSIYDVSQAKVEVQFTVQKSNGSTVDLADQCCLASNGWSLFENAKLYLGEQEILNVQKPGKVVQIRNLTEGSKQWIETCGDLAHYYIDQVPTSSGTTGQAAYVAPMTGTSTGTSPVSQYHPIQYVKGVIGSAGTVEQVMANSQYDPSFKAKVDRAVAGLQRVFLPLADVFPLLKTTILQGTKVEVELNKISNVQEALYSTISTTGSLIAISRVVLWIPRIKPSLSALARWQEKVTATPQVQIEYENLSLHKLAYSNSTAGDAVWTLSSKSNKPLRAYLVFQRPQRDTSQAHNSLEFDLPVGKTNLLSKVSIRANGKETPQFPYTPNTDYTRVLNDLYVMTGKSFSDVDSAPITRANWASLYPVFGFDLSAAESSAYESRSITNLEVNWTTTSDTGSSYNVYLVMVSLGKAVIDYSSSLTTLKLV